MRQTMRLPFGGGLDRATGLALLDPTSFRDLRNVELLEGRAQARTGITARTSLSLDGLGTVPLTDVVALDTYRAVARGVAVGYDTASRKLQLFSTSSVGLNPVFHATLGVVDASVGRPLVSLAESALSLFIAHDYPDVTKRLGTQVWDGTALTALQANLDGAGTVPVLFRGVVAYLGYLMGWGYGSASDPQRPEVVRVSLPGQPTVFANTDYFRAGTSGQAVLAVVPLSGAALVLKQTETYRIEGTDRPSFGIVPVERYYGIAASRLWAVADGVCYFWSLDGPRRTVGGVSEDVAIPLDLTGPTPADLVASGDLADGFACYRYDRRLLEFHFGRRAYVLHLRDPGHPRWSYRENGVELRCAGLFYVGAPITQGTAAPTGSPAVGALTVTTSTLTVPLTYTGAVGDESLEVWLRLNGGTWVQKVNRVVANTTGETIQFTAADGLGPGMVCDVAARFRRGTYYTAGYSSSNPLDWPVGSRGTATTTSGAGTPSAVTEVGPQVTVVGSKSYNSFRFTWTAGTPGSTSQVLESRSNTADGAAVLWSGPIATTDTGYIGSYLVQPGVTSNRWFFVRHLMADGTPGTAAACAGNPVNVSQGTGGGGGGGL